MSDAMSDSLKPDFWEKFFWENRIFEDINASLLDDILDYDIMSELKIPGTEVELIQLKRKIMNGLLEIYSKGYENEPYYAYMFKEECRWPSDY